MSDEVVEWIWPPDASPNTKPRRQVGGAEFAAATNWIDAPSRGDPTGAPSGLHPIGGLVSRTNAREPGNPPNQRSVAPTADYQGLQFDMPPCDARMTHPPCFINTCGCEEYLDLPKEWPHQSVPGGGSYVLMVGPGPSVQPTVLMGWDACAASVVAEVWAFIQENVNVVQWAMCMAGADAEMIECVNGYLTGELGPIQFWRSGDPGMLGAISTTQTSINGVFQNSPYITFNAGDGTLFDISCEIWCSDNETDKECAIAALAASLVHELTHVCGAKHMQIPETEFDEFGCSIPILTGSYFAAAVFGSNPAAAASPCCADYLTLAFPPGTSLPGFVESCNVPGASWVRNRFFWMPLGHVDINLYAV